VVLTAVCYFFGTCSKGEEGILGLRYWAWAVSGINVVLLGIWANVLPEVKDFLDYMRSIATSAIDLLPILTSISNPPEISRVAEKIVVEQLSISSPISNPPEILRVAEQIVAENTPFIFKEQEENSRKRKKKSKKKS
jgi:hypothetical protein